MLIIQEVSLPSDYLMIEDGDIEPAEVVALREASGITLDNNPAYWQQQLVHSLAVIGVRYMGNDLIGIGVLTGTATLGWQTNVLVDPEHRHKGIGTAIVEARAWQTSALTVNLGHSATQHAVYSHS